MNRSRCTIVESFGGRHQTRCGYCKQTAQRFSHGEYQKSTMCTQNSRLNVSSSHNVHSSICSHA